MKDAGGESDLDFQLAYPLIYPQTITLYQTDDLNYATNPNSTSLGGFNTFLDALDGVSTTSSTCVELQLNSYSHTVHIQLLAKQGMTQYWILLIQIQPLVDTKVSYNAVCTSQPMSSRYPMEAKNSIFPHTIRSASATSS